jgi:hypothetical protein
MKTGMGDKDAIYFGEFANLLLFRVRQLNPAKDFTVVKNAILLSAK